MLYLNPPYHIIEGVSVFPDHADPRQYYYLPLQPRLTERADPTTGRRVPQIQLIEYRGSAGNGGFLNFDVNIGVEQQVIETIRRKLQNLDGLDELPRLAPAPIRNGTVRMMLFGHKSSPEEENGEEENGEEPRFVVKIDQAAHPSLYGDNQAAFSVELDREGVIILKQALEGEMSPIGVIYSLEYLALRPAYAVHIEANWDRVQTHFEESFGAETLFTSVQISEVVDKLIENRDIVIEVDTFIPEDEAEGMITRRDRAVNEFKDMVLQTFFEPTLEPIREEEDGWDKFLHTSEQLSTMAATGGWGGVAQFSYKKVDMTRVDRKRLNVNMRERTTVRRNIYPQGHLQGLARVIRDSDMSLDDFIVSATLDDPWFQRRKVTAVSRANFEGDRISSLDVRLRYGQNTTNLILDKANPQRSVEWPSIIENDAMDKRVEYQYRVNFRDVDATERPQRLETEDRVFEGETLEIHPRAENVYYVIDVPIVADQSFPWETYPEVEVQCRYEDEENGIHQNDSFRIRQDQPDRVWEQFVLDPNRVQFDYRLTYHGADNRDVEKGWSTQERGDISLEDPFPSKRELTVLSALNWAEVQLALVSLRYEDPDNEIMIQKNVQLDANSGFMKTVTFDVEDPRKRLVTYEATIIFKNGSFRRLPRSTTFDPQIIISTDMRGHRVIPVQPENVAFNQRQLETMDVELQFEDPVAGLSFADATTFRSPEDQFFFEYDYADENRTTYRHRVTYHFDNGMSRTIDWQTSNEPSLRVAVG